jgi:hypothetical protein
LRRWDSGGFVSCFLGDELLPGVRYETLARECDDGTGKHPCGQGPRLAGR